MSDPFVFVNPDKRSQWETDHHLVQDTDLREHCAKIIGDAMEAIGGLQ